MLKYFLKNLKFFILAKLDYYNLKLKSFNKRIKIIVKDIIKIAL